MCKCGGNCTCQRGERGRTGPIGPQGPKGDTGPQGLQGFPGLNGADGIQGLKGDKGDTGEKGDTGDTGPEGPSGVAGAAGANGIDGVDGAKGDKGDKGDIGDTGPTGPAGPQGSPGIAPVGVVLPWAGLDSLPPPTGWLFCDGSVYTSVAYPSLILTIGTSFNIGGEVAGEFRVPNMEERIPVGYGGTLLTVGATGGTADNTIGNGNLPEHTHTFSGTTGDGKAQLQTAITSDSDETRIMVGADGGVTTADERQQPVAHTHPFSGTTANGGGVTSPIPIDNMQPYVVMRYIIKY